MSTTISIYLKCKNKLNLSTSRDAPISMVNSSLSLRDKPKPSLIRFKIIELWFCNKICTNLIRTLLTGRSPKTGLTSIYWGLGRDDGTRVCSSNSFVLKFQQGVVTLWKITLASSSLPIGVLKRHFVLENALVWKTHVWMNLCEQWWHVFNSLKNMIYFWSWKWHCKWMGKTVYPVPGFKQ